MYDSTRHSKPTVAESLCRPTTYSVPVPLLARPLGEPLQCYRKPPKKKQKNQTSVAYETSDKLQGQHNLLSGALQKTRPSPPMLHFSSSETLRC